MSTVDLKALIEKLEVRRDRTRHDVVAEALEDVIESLNEMLKEATEKPVEGIRCG